MTISNATNKSGPYTENGVTTEFEYGFKIDDETHIKVVRAAGSVETVLGLGADYTVTGVGADAGNIVIAVPVVGSTLTLVRDVPFVQLTELENQGAYFAKVVEAALDLAAARDQQLAEELGRTVKVPITSDPAELTIQIDNIIRLGGSADQIDIVAANIDVVVAVPAYLGQIVSSTAAAAASADLAEARRYDAEAQSDASAVSAGQSLSYSGISQGGAASSLAAAQDAQDLVQQATAGFVGFIDGSGYDFGSVASETTYFDRDFGSIV